jgi:hypothetical protein
MQAQTLAMPIGIANLCQYDVPGGAVQANSNTPRGVADKNAYAEKIAAATINTPRPKAAPTIAGRMQTKLIANHIKVRA